MADPVNYSSVNRYVFHSLFNCIRLYEQVNVCYNQNPPDLSSFLRTKLLFIFKKIFLLTSGFRLDYANTIGEEKNMMVVFFQKNAKIFLAKSGKNIIISNVTIEMKDLK